MGKKDIRYKTLEELNDVFADIVNVLLFHGKRLIKEKDLSDVNPRSNYSARGKVREQERDVAKFWKKHEVRIALVGLENQTREDADMPIRMIGYDGAAYRDQLKHNETKKTKQRYPVVSLVLYFGHQKRWRAPKRLKECFEIDEALKPYVNDYKMNLFEIAYLSEEQVSMFRSDFRIVADYFVQMRKKNDYQPKPETIRHVGELLALMSAVTNDPRFEDNETVLLSGRRKITMCEVLDKVEARGMEKGIEKGIEKGMEKGKLDTLISLVRDGVLTIKDAAARAGVSPGTFSRKMKAYRS